MVSEKAYFQIAESDIQKSIELGRFEKVDIDIDECTYEKIKELADLYGVSLDGIVNGALHLFISNYNEDKQEDDIDSDVKN